MYCNHCGADNPDSATYCNHCGSPISDGQSAEQPSRQQRQIIRNSEIIELERMIRYFSQKAEQYSEYDRLNAEINRFSKGKHHALLVWGIIAAALGVFAFSASSSSLNNNARGMVACLCLLPGAGMIVGYIFYARSFNRKIDRMIYRKSELEEELLDYYNDFGACVVGAEYTNPSNLSAIQSVIQSGRADTIKEAINILTEDAYRNNMQKYAAQTAQNTASAARGAKAGAIFAAANFFLKK